MKTLRKIRDYLCYCGISKDEYNAVKKDAYVSNFRVWRILHILISVVFAVLFFNSLFDDLLRTNELLYFAFLIYTLISSVFFFIMREDSLIAQFWIYLSISLLLLFGCFLTKNNLDHPSTTFIVLLLISPMFMIDKPFFMGIELAVASAIYLTWMHAIKDPLIWKMDLINVLTFAASAFFIHIILNSIRIREFVLTRKINMQKDIDDLTGLKNKGAVTREINSYLADPEKSKGILFILDIDRFKVINDTYGHDVGDDVIQKLGEYLNGYFSSDEIVGRFGGDEFIFFKKGTDDEELAVKIAEDIVSEIPQHILLPDGRHRAGASIGIAMYRGDEKNYSELFKKADLALYDVKLKRVEHYKLYKEN